MKKSLFFSTLFVGLSFVAFSTQALDNTGFETPDYGSDGWAYNPGGGSWGFSSNSVGGSGLSGPNGPWKCDVTSPDPLGDQFAFLQRAASVTQDMSGLVVGATYELSFYESYRSGHEPGNDLHVILDEGLPNEVTIYENNNVINRSWVLRHSSSFVAEKASYILTFRSTDPLGSGDRTTIIDGVTLTRLDFGFVGISNDSDCGISRFKHYTHKLDFGNGTPGALINGVQFDAYNANSNGLMNFTRTVTGEGTPASHDGNPPPGTSGNLVALMRDMYYIRDNAANGVTTWTLSGLTAGVTYDARIYTRQWATSSTRLATMLFDPDGTGVVSDETGEISEDEATSVGMASDTDPYYINYRFTAVTDEDLVIVVTQKTFNASWHLYGISCEEVQPVPQSLLPADDAIGVLLGTDLVINFDSNVEKSSGDISIHLGSDDSVVATIDVSSNAVTVNGSTVTINLPEDLKYNTEYYVLFDAGAFVDYAGRGSPALTDTTLWNFTTLSEVFSFVPITGDDDCEIAAYKKYTHKLDFGNGTPGALINGVQFDAYNANSNGLMNFTRTFNTGTSGSHDGNSSYNVSGGLGDLMRDMYYNKDVVAGGITTWTLTGLTPGADYIARIYVRNYENIAGHRTCSMVFDPDGSGPISDSISRILEDNSTSVGLDSATAAYYINYPFTAVEGEDLVITVTQYDAGDSWHLYGLTNEEVPPTGTLMIIE